MNKRIKKKQIRLKNKKLCKRYPFLIPRNRWTGKIVDNYNYDWTELDCMPNGWRRAFGKQFMEELRKECIKYNYLDKLRIMEIKEKFSGLRFYVEPVPKNSKIFEIIDKYENLSYNYCMICGKEGKLYNDGWMTTLCETHAKKFGYIKE